LSTLTKVLIVLLTVFSLFLSGIVVTFVANQENYRQSAEKNRRDLGSAEKARDNAQQLQIDEKKAAEVLVAKLEDEKNRLTKDPRRSEELTVSSGRRTLTRSTRA
jgi:hypothetical protein